jgi:dolichyl-phosphate beta-glucosyltransferase
MSNPLLTIIVPAYNEAKRLGPTLDRILGWLDGRGITAEVLVVDDGSQDGTAELVAARAASDPRLVALRYPGNRGKGFAVGFGVERSRGELVLFTDADLSTPIEYFDKLERALQGADVAIASRALPESRIPKRQPFYREGMGRIFNLLVRSLVLGGIHDTQCGFKLFRGEIARDLFRRRRLDGFSFDVEILYLARRAGVRIVEVPVEWFNDEATRVDALRDSAKMFADLVTIRWIHRND